MVAWQACDHAAPCACMHRFCGTVEGGLLTHTDGRTLIYPLGSTIVLRDKKDPRAQEFLQGHSDKVKCLSSCTWQGKHGHIHLLSSVAHGPHLVSLNMST